MNPTVLVSAALSINDDMECDDGGCCDDTSTCTDDGFYSELMEITRPMTVASPKVYHHTTSHPNQIEKETDKNTDDETRGCSSSSTLNIPMMMSLETTRLYAIQALALTVQEWNTMGQSTDPTVADTSIFTTTTTSTSTTNTTKEIDEDVILQQCVHRVTSLFLVRIVAIVLHRQAQQQQEQPINSKWRKPKQIDLSTSGICRQILIVDDDDNGDDPEHSPPPWSFLTRNIVQQLEQYIRYILTHYATHTKLPFHNQQHAVTVVTNCNKLIDFILDPNNNQSNYSNDKYNHTPTLYHYNDEHPDLDDSNIHVHQNHNPASQRRQRSVITYGLRNDPLLMFALLFAALIHDVQHEGKLNSQLVLTSTTSPISAAALLYNDQSVQEMRSLHVAFEELLKEDYTELRNILFQNCDPNHMTYLDGSPSAYRYFRNAVISAVLSTDLASPERMAVSRSKWKEAFFSPNRQHPPQNQPPSNVTGSNKNQRYHRRASAASNESKPQIIRPLHSDGRFYHRRGSNYSEMSEITTDEGNEPVVITEFALQQLRLSSSIHVNRRNSVTSEISAGSYQQQQLRRWSQSKGQYPPASHYRQRRRSSIQSDVSSDCESSEVAVDSVALMYNKHNNVFARTAKDDASVDSIVSDTIDSYVLRTTKVVKMKREDEFKQQSSSTNQPNELLNGNNDIRNDVSASSIEHTTPQRTLSAETDGSTSFVSYPTGSIAVIQKRLEGAPKTRRRATHITTFDDNDLDCDVADANDPLEHSGHDETNTPHATKNTKNVQFSNSKQGEYGHSPFSPSSSDNDDDEDNNTYEYEKQRQELYSSPPSKQIIKPVFPPTTTNNSNSNTAERIRNYGNVSTGPTRMITRRASTGAISRFGSLTDLRIDENHSNNGESLVSYNDDDDDNDHNALVLKSMNVDLPEIPKYRKRLGIRRSMDLSGEAIEFYPKRNSIGNISTFSGNHQPEGTNDIDNDDETDYIKASAIIEALLRMADVGHYYQNWQNMTVWSARIFQERMLAEPNPAKQDEIYTNWFNNQILIIDSYLKPLAVQLDEAGVFGECNGMMFVQNVEEIRRHWMIYGYKWSQKLLHGVEKQL